MGQDNRYLIKTLLRVVDSITNSDEPKTRINLDHLQNLKNMANQEHLAVLKQGVKQWNKWRQENPIIRPDISQVKLIGLNFERLNLSGVNLREVSFREANLRKANFSNADLSWASLSKADLRQITLTGANLYRTSFVSANLSENDFNNIKFRDAYLQYVNLSETNLTNIDLKDLDLYESNFSFSTLKNVDFSKSRLKKVKFNKTNLIGVLFLEADLTAGDFREASMQKIDFSNSNLFRANFSELHFIQQEFHESVEKESSKLYDDILNRENHKKYSKIKSQVETLNENNEYIDKYLDTYFEKKSRNKKIKHINLQEKRIDNFNFTGANFSETILINTFFKDLSLVGQNFELARLDNAKFLNVDLQKSNLSQAILRKACFRDVKFTLTDFSEADLSQANLEEAFLYKTNFSKAKLYQTNLKKVNLRETNLSQTLVDQTNLEGVDFRETNLDGTHFQGANLKKSNFTSTTLEKISFINSNLSESLFIESRIIEVDFTDAVLSNSNFKGATTIKSIFINSDLSNSELSFSNLREANFKNANLRGAILVATQALGANFENADFTGACLEDWNINSKTNLENVTCDYIYRKQGREERRPSDPNQKFCSGEFTKLFQKVLETVDLVFTDGIDWQAFLTSFQNVKVQYKSSELAIQAIEKKSGDAFVLRVEVPPDVKKPDVETSLKLEYTKALECLEEKYRQELNAKDQEINIHRKHNADLLEIVKLVASKPMTINTMAQSESTAGNIHRQSGNFGIGQMSGGKIESGAKVAGVINEAQQQNLTEAAAGIKKLLDQLSLTYSAETLTQQEVVAEEAIKQIEKDFILKERVVGVIKAMGVEVLMEVIDHPVANILRAGIEAFTNPGDN